MDSTIHNMERENKWINELWGQSWLGDHCSCFLVFGNVMNKIQMKLCTQ